MTLLPNNHPKQYNVNTRVEEIQVCSGVSATNESLATIDVIGAKKITFQGKGSSLVNRTAQFKVMATIDGTNFVQINTTVGNAPNTSSQTLARYSTMDISVNGDYMFPVDMQYFCFKQIVIAVTVTDGETPEGTFDFNALVEY